MRLFISILTILIISSCNDIDSSKANVTLVRAELRNLNNRVAMTQPPIAVYHLEILNCTNNVLVINCLESVSISFNNGNSLDNLNVSPERSYLNAGEKDTIILYKQLLDKLLTEKKAYTYVNEIENIVIETSHCENYAAFIPESSLNRLGNNITLLEEFNIKKEPNYKIITE